MASLQKRQGLLGKRLAAHLLRRATYHVTPSRINTFAGLTAEQAVNQLFTIPNLAEPKGPINFEDSTTYWLTDGPYANGPSDNNDKKRCVLFWFYNELLNDTSIRQKMTIYLSGIFVTAEDNDWRIFDNIRLMQMYAVGNIKEFAYKVTLDNRMLRYLNNNVNNKWSPNENYAREFLELFTILKGPQKGPGDYTNYTEHDIQMAARVLTGFDDHDITLKDPQTGLSTGRALYSRHDFGNKQFSSAFDNKVIMGAVDEQDMYREFQEFIDMIFDKVETARAFIRRLYLFFVSDNIDAEIEQDIIEPLALQLWADGYNVENALKRLLKSVHFYDEDDSTNTDEIIGGKIKSPLELYITSINLFEANKMGGLNATPSNLDEFPRRFVERSLEFMGFPDYATSVEGYAGFFKSPSFSKNWIDSSSIVSRYKMPQALFNGHSVRYTGNALPFQVDVVDFVADNFSNPDYANQLLTQIYEILLPEMPDQARSNYFKNKLLGGVTVINWMFEWQSYLATNDKSAVKVTLEDLFEAIMNSPEFQTF